MQQFVKQIEGVTGQQTLQETFTNDQSQPRVLKQVSIRNWSSTEFGITNFYKLALVHGGGANDPAILLDSGWLVGGNAYWQGSIEVHSPWVLDCVFFECPAGSSVKLTGLTEAKS